jgi:hypothetical protein
MNSTASAGRIGAAIFVALLFLGPARDAKSLPAFAAQTGQRCQACHVGGNWPELTPWGRFFKLTGYTVGKSAWSSETGFDHVPAGVFGQAGITWGKQPNDSQGNPVFVDNGQLELTEVTGYIAGKITDFAGVFLEYSRANNFPGWSSGSDLMDARAISWFHPGDHELLLGVTVNDDPTVQDVWNTVPAWTFPYYSSPVAPGPPANPLIGGLANQVAGVGVYAWLDRKVYAEISAYRTALGFWRWMSWGQSWNQPGGTTYVDGYNPYWRLNYSDQDGPHAWMIGTFGLQANVFPNNLQPTGTTDRFTDVGFDAQYQYLADLDKFTVRATYIHEKQNWNASFPLGNTANPTDTVTQFTISGTWWRDQWGLSAAYFQNNGSDDANLYGVFTPSGSLVSASPNTNGYVLELDYLLTQNIKVMAQYTGYRKFNGLSSNIDGIGRSASDNSSFFLNLMVAY